MLVRVLFLSIAVAVCCAPARTGAAQLPVSIAVFQMPGAAAAVDLTGKAGIGDAASGALALVPVASFAFPHRAALLHPVVIWVRVPADPRWLSQGFSVETSFDVVDATLWVPKAGGGWSATPFGMGIPYADRAVVRLVPTAQIRATAGGALFLRLAYSKESSQLSIVDGAAIAAEDAGPAAQLPIQMIFMGIFVALGLTNLVLFAFARESMYVIYSVAMFFSALCTGTLGYPFAWAIFWPGWSPPHFLAIMLPTSVVITCVVFFTSDLLNVRSYWRSLDRFLRAFAVVAAINGTAMALWYASARIGGVDVSEIATQAVVIPYVILVAAGIKGWRARNPDAPFVVVGFALLALGSGLYTSQRWTIADASQSLPLPEVGLVCASLALFAALAARLQRMKAEALEQASAVAEQRRLAFTDGLTGISNRRAYDETLAREWERYSRDGVPLGLILVDIDLFKKYNDTYGHVAGDACLQSVARAAQACVRRPNDLFARYGGEEFAAILPGTDEAGAIVMAQSMCDAVRDLRIEHATSSYGFVSISVGVASTASQRFEPTLAGAADEALYRAKESGRNRVESYGHLRSEETKPS